jgi:alcohol dehydrogenase class IV
MTARTPADGGPWRFEFDPAVIRFGEGSVSEFATDLAQNDLERAMVVTGQTVGTTTDVIGPVRNGLDDRLGGVFAETTPKKRLATGVAAAERFDEIGADCLVSLGGGSSLDVAKVAAIAVASDLSATELGSELESTGTLPVPDAVPPILAIPTTLAGADLSSGGGVSASMKNGLVTGSTGGGVWDPALMPVALVADPELVATTPRSILAASAMNGFDKGIESLYAPTGTPITDGTAANGLSLLVDALPALSEEPVTPDEVNPIVRGILLVQYGISRPDASNLSLIHAFGHAISAAGPHQGTAHATVAPEILRYVFERTDGPRPILADALGVDDGADRTAGVVDAVADVRDGLGLPTRLRELENIDRDDIPELAAGVMADDLVANVPPAVDPVQDDMAGILERAW